MTLSPDQEFLLLQFWSLSVEVARKLPIEVRSEIEGLQPAIELLTNLPVAIGWEDDAATLLDYVTKRSQSQNNVKFLK